MSELYPQVALKVTFRSINTIHKMFKFKDTIPHNLQSSVVYLFTCASCRAAYIGKRKRHLMSRIHEHLGRSVRTGQLITNPPHSAIRNHSHTHDHPFNPSDFTVLGSSNYNQDLTIMEALYQHKYNLSINHTASYKLFCFSR